ncbi:MAG: adenylosuccinate synthetase [Pseudonocardiaceae bacterium]
MNSGSWTSLEIVKLVIRTGGPNAGHIIEYQSRFCGLQSIPCAFTNTSCLLALGAGVVIDESVLCREVDRFAIDPTRLIIDPQAIVIKHDHSSAELDLVRRIGSTGKGVGAATAEKVLSVIG